MSATQPEQEPRTADLTMPVSSDLARRLAASQQRVTEFKNLVEQSAIWQAFQAAKESARADLNYVLGEVGIKPSEFDAGVYKMEFDSQGLLAGFKKAEQLPEVEKAGD